MQPGDLLLAFFAYEAPIDGFDAQLTGGSPAWQLLTSRFTTAGEEFGFDGLVASGIWWKQASDDDEWTVASEDNDFFSVMSVIAITDALLEAPEYRVSADQTSTSTSLRSISSPAGPPPAIGDLELRWVAGDNYNEEANRSWSGPSGASEVADLSDGYLTAQLTQQAITDPVSSSRTHTVSAGVYAAHGFTLRIRPAPVPVLARPVQLSGAAAVHRATSW
ncbi:hypothetical protein [Nonomuraea maritima]|uniref:hypothetical protein n=1 Tax=Nonomuraea maritima TaxID=683260 RepID=UPI00371949F6